MQRGMFTIQKALYLMLSVLLILNLSFFVYASANNTDSSLPCSLKVTVTDTGYCVSIKTFGKHPPNAKLYTVSYSGSSIKEINILPVKLTEGSTDFFPELSGTMLKSTALKFFLWDNELCPLAPSVSPFKDNLPCTLNAVLSDDGYTVTVENKGFKMHGRIITALYSCNGAASVSTFDATVKNGTNIYYPNFPAEIEDYNADVKVFLWDDEMHPSAKSVSPIFTFSLSPPKYEPMSTSSPLSSDPHCYEITFCGNAYDIDKYLRSITSVEKDGKVFDKTDNVCGGVNLYSLGFENNIYSSLLLSAENLGNPGKLTEIRVSADGYKDQKIIIGPAAELDIWSADRIVDDFGTVTYAVDKKDESGIFYFNFSGEHAGKDFDMSKVRIGLVVKDDIKGTVEFVGKDIRLWGSYRKVASEEELVPGTYCTQTNPYGDTFLKCMLAEIDASRINGSGNVEKISDTKDEYTFIIAMESDWYEGSTSQYILVQAARNVLVINDFRTKPDVYYTYTSEETGEKFIYATSGKILVPLDCEKVTFCTFKRVSLKEVILDDETLSNGVDFSEIHR